LTGIRYQGPRQQLRQVYKTGRSIFLGGSLLVINDLIL
jgi:hypothetical protein